MQRGITFFEIIMIIAILALIAAIAVPNLLESNTQPGENSGLADLRTIVKAQQKYINKYGVCGTLDELGDEKLLDDNLVSATQPDSHKNGYYFTMYISKDSKSWNCIARPSKWDLTGGANFKADPSGFYYNKTDKSSDWFALGSESDPIANLKSGLDSYEENKREPVDDKDNMARMYESVQVIKKKKLYSGVDILLDVWLYYDATDNEVAGLARETLLSFGKHSLPAIEEKIEDLTGKEFADRIPMLQKLKKEIENQ